MNRSPTKTSLLACTLFVILSAHAGTNEILLAQAVASTTNVDWMALAKAQRTINAGGRVEFRWATNQEASYATIRKVLWLAALHGITDQTATDDDTRRILAPELAAAKRRLETPFAPEVAVRETPNADRLFSALVQAQSDVALIDSTAPCALPTVLASKGHEVTSEKSDVTFTSVPIAVSFTQACHTDDGLVFEKNGCVAHGLFVRRFRDRTATVVNLSLEPRTGLFYRGRFSKIAFDLPPEGIIHLTGDAPPRQSRDCGDRFLSELWQVTFEGGVRSRLVDSDVLPSVVDENYRGRVIFRTTAIIPSGGETLVLHLDDPEAETEVWLGGQLLGSRAWEPFEWTIPMNCHGRNMTLEIRLWKRSLKETLQSAPTWRRR